MAFASIKAKAKAGKDFEPVPAGVHLAICTQVIDLGFQEGYTREYAPKQKVYIKFEIPDIIMQWEKNGQPMSGPATVGREFGLSISEKSHLRPFLEGWRGKAFTPAEEDGFEITSILGKICQISIVHAPSNDGKKVYANISGAFPLIQLQKDYLKANPSKGKPSQPLVVYSPTQHDQAIYEALPEWIRKKIDNRVDEPGEDVADTNQDTGSTAEQSQDFDDDIPF